MYSRSSLARKYLRYYFTAENGRGHGIHSPFVYDFVKNVLNDGRVFPAYAAVEARRKSLHNNTEWLDIEDLGAGSVQSRSVQSESVQSRSVESGSVQSESVQSGLPGASPVSSASPASRRRRIGDLARSAAKPRKLGQLLFRIAHYYQPKTLLELGTSLGLSTAYLAAAVPGGMVKTIEGAPAVAETARKNFREMGLDNITLITGNFDEVLPVVLDGMQQTGQEAELVFIDGNHRLEPTLRYFNWLLERSAPSSILIFDDIHWSAEMEEAWAAIRQDPRVKLTIDLFFIGLVVLREEFKVKQHFTIRF